MKGLAQIPIGLWKNENYWDKDNVKLDKINFDVVKEAPTALNLFQDGQADDVILSGELAQQMAKDPELVIEKKHEPAIWNLISEIKFTV